MKVNRDEVLAAAEALYEARRKCDLARAERDSCQTDLDISQSRLNVAEASVVKAQAALMQTCSDKKWDPINSRMVPK